MLDPISEMLIRIKNAQRAGKNEVRFNASKLKFAIAKILERENFVGSVSKEKNGSKEEIRISLKYRDISRTKKVPFISEIKRISREGQRVYIKKENLRKVRNDFGISIISTSQGVMTGKEAKKAGLGGEYLCEVW